MSETYSSDFTDSSTTNKDDNYTAPSSAVFNNQGNVTVLVANDGSRYTVIGGSFAKTFSTKDSANVHN